MKGGSVALWIAIGAGVGLTLGALLGSTALGIAFGAAAGVVVGSSLLLNTRQGGQP